MNFIFDQIKQLGIIPVVVLNNAKNALPLAQALIDGGLPCAEITFRTEAAEESLHLISEHYPDLLLAAGTILTPEQADRAVAAGAKFVISPGFNPQVVKHCLEKNITVIPGCSTPSDMEQALSLGLEVVKFFPAEAAGGLNYIKAVSAPYTSLRFMPTGGISPSNVKEYLAYPRILACGGSWMVKASLIEAGDFSRIKELTQEAVSIAASVRKKLQDEKKG